MKQLTAILILLVIVATGFLFLWKLLGRSHANVPPPGKGVPVSFTDSNGNRFTVFIAGEMVNGTNIVVSNLNVKIHPARPGTITPQPTNETSK
jgi:hypothetical protein